MRPASSNTDSDTDSDVSTRFADQGTDSDKALLARRPGYLEGPGALGGHQLKRRVFGRRHKHSPHRRLPASRARVSRVGSKSASESEHPSHNIRVRKSEWDRAIQVNRVSVRVGVFRRSRHCPIHRPSFSSVHRFDNANMDKIRALQRRGRRKHLGHVGAVDGARHRVPLPARAASDSKRTGDSDRPAAWTGPATYTGREASVRRPVGPADHRPRAPTAAGQVRAAVRDACRRAKPGDFAQICRRGGSAAEGLPAYLWSSAGGPHPKGPGVEWRAAASVSASSACVWRASGGSERERA